MVHWLIPNTDSEYTAGGASVVAEDRTNVIRVPFTHVVSQSPRSGALQDFHGTTTVILPHLACS